MRDKGRHNSGVRACRMHWFRLGMTNTLGLEMPIMALSIKVYSDFV